MGIALTEEQTELARVARAFLDRSESVTEARALLDTEAAAALPPHWAAAAALGWFGLHVPEALGGSGAGLVELAVMAEECGRACASGPLLPTVILAGALTADTAAATHHTRLLAGLLDGTVAAGLGIGDELTAVEGVVHGQARVIGGARTEVVGFLTDEDILLVDVGSAGLVLRERSSLDPSMPVADATLDGVAADGTHVLAGAAATALHLLDLLVAALSVGGAAACRERTVGYACDREAFGRPIGQFQAVKHACADRYVDEQLAVGLTWDAAQAGRAIRGRLLAGAAADLAVDAFWAAATTMVQVHGGIGFTWEHDAHLFLRRAGALRALRGSSIGRRFELLEQFELATDDGADTPDIPTAAAARAAAGTFAAEHARLPAQERVAHLVDSGYLYPHWPAPWGLAAKPAEQLVIKQELAGVSRFEHLGPTAWELPIILPTIIVHGTATQQAAWIRPTMLGELTWCQLFSEPSAGSDLAAVATRAVEVPGGWELTGQKVWTSTAQHARLGLALARTDPAAARHHGISCLVVDMHAPGITIRPLRQITGETEFNEVFLDRVFVPADHLVGEIHGGWEVARTMLEFERGASGGTDPRADQLTSATVLSPSQWELCRRHWGWMRDRAVTGGDRDVVAAVGALAETELALRALRRRAADRVVLGLRSAGEGSVIRLATTTHVQRFAETGHSMLGPDGVWVDGNAEATQLVLYSRMATIAGGTSEIQRNVIAERVLGLPRDPRP